VQRKPAKQGGSAQERLLETAVDVFGRYGYEAATTRMVARAAGVNIAAIPYYFGGKEGLYRAVVGHVVAMVKDQVADTMRSIAGQSYTGPDGRREATLALEGLLEKVTAFMIGSAEAPRVARIILREQLYPSAAYDLIFKGFLEPMLDTLATLLMVVASEPSRRIAQIRAMALVGQVMGFRMARETVVRAIGMQGYNDEERREIQQVILEHTRAMVAALDPGDMDGKEAQ